MADGRKNEYYKGYLIINLFELAEGEAWLVSEEGVAPTVERWTPNPTVAGSNPVDLTFLLKSNINIIVL